MEHWRIAAYIAHFVSLLHYSCGSLLRNLDLVEQLSVI